MAIKRPNISELEVVYETYKKCGSKRETARILGLAESTVRLHLKYHTEHYSKPISENDQKYREEWTAQDCINELRRIAELDEEKVISRNYFRNHAMISEATWTKFFGTFLEFKRQAGIILSRQAHHLERQIAKHASIDQHRKMNIERRSYEGKYLKLSESRYKTILICSDIHDTACDDFYLEVLIDTAKRLQPDILVFNGDIFDLPEFSRFTVDPREWDVVERIKFVHEQVFAPLRKVCPNTQFDFIEGNHEYRLIKHLSDSTPALKVILSDLHGFTVPKLLGLDKYQINYIAKADMSAYMKSDINKEVKKNYKVYFDSILVHHDPQGKMLGVPGVNGHHHKTKVDSLYNETFQSYQWVQSAAGHRSDASYTMGEKWNLGFVIAHIDVETKRTVFEPITFQNFAVVGGKYYERKS